MNNRRGFISKIIGFILSFSLLSSCKTRNLTNAAISIGKISQFNEGANNLDFYRLVLFKETIGNRINLHVMSKLCTHQSCLLDRSASGFVCPCHGSVFSESGQVLKGPANKDLPYFKLSMDNKKQINVDFAKLVNSEWRLKISVS